MSNQPEPGTIRVRLGVVAIASLLLAVAALTTLVIIVAIQGADLLSVVALALAVIAFSAQLIIYIVQAAESAADNRRSLELHAQLSALLSELRERTGRTQQSVDSINSKLLSAVIGKTRAMSEPSSDPEAFAEQVAETYAEVSRETSSSLPSPTSASAPSTRSNLWPPPLPPDEAELLHSYLTQWPSAAETPAIVDELGSLEEMLQDGLFSYARDLVRTTKTGSKFGPGLHPVTKMRELGLTEKVKGWKLDTLSSKGMRLARAFVAVGEPPPHASALVPYRIAAIRRADTDNRDPDDAT
ncbi:hypothetical protein M3672_07990 [Microbacterium enclense]|uniref:hypothetical protein n=1 Tax=Microbacterium enclense TaxID=993073 RepID=UPI00204152D7|nr:hypothetical protein [Microbacterium enclense]MCM3614380.1 hypothetical protein [Microbacterium enclense]